MQYRSKAVSFLWGRFLPVCITALPLESDLQMMCYCDSVPCPLFRVGCANVTCSLVLSVCQLLNVSRAAQVATVDSVDCSQLRNNVRRHIFSHIMHVS